MLSDPITRRALAEVLILALALGPLGVWVLLHRQAYAAESLSHGLLPGLVLAALAGLPLVLGAAGGALVAAGALALAVAAALAAAHRPLSLAAFDRPAARSLGARPARWEAALLALLGVGTVAAAPGLGSLLLVALVIAPGAAALRVTRRLPAALVLAAALAMAAGVGGLALSYYADLAAGASIALCAAAAPTLARLAT
jgi:ABC-type Mn2+/Zn2+ transport system permease subunit